MPDDILRVRAVAPRFGAACGMPPPNRVLKNKHQAVSQGGYWLEARRLERQEAKKDRKGFASSFPASQPSIFGHKTHFQKPSTVGLARAARFPGSRLNGLYSFGLMPLSKTISPSTRFV
jgi:hypothetical protein